MKNLVEFLKESNDEDVYVVYMCDDTMVNFFYTEKEAETEKNKLNKEAPGNEAYVKKEPKKNIEK